MISLIALITAMCGFLNEMNFAQALTATMGGTVLRYQTTFGLFTFSLGMGAWLMDALHTRWTARTLLLTSQWVMAGLSIAGPLWIQTFNPLLRSDGALLFTLLCYLPVVLAGLVSGVELPALLHLVKHRPRNRFSPLAWDYVGMFVASAAFPMVLLYSLGVFGISAFTMGLSLMAGFLVFFFVPSTPLAAKVPSERSTHSHFLLFCVFALSFCSFSYELLLAKILADLLHDETLAYSLGIGFMLAGLGIGTWLAQKTKSTLKTLIIAEVLLIGLGSLLYTLFYSSGTFIYSYPPLKFITLSKWWAICVLSPLPLAIGILTGYELPLCLKLIAQRRPSSADATATAIGLNYLGALASGLLVPLLLLPWLGTSSSLHLVAGINMVILVGLVLSQKPVSRTFRVGASFAACIFILIGVRGDRWAEQLFLKTYYYELRISGLAKESLLAFQNMADAIPPVERDTTAYQFIDKVKNDRPGSPWARPGFVLYLNKQQQVDSRSWRTYHDSLTVGAANLHHAPVKNVFVGGGGDGLLARVLLEDPNIEKITLVELDPRMLELAKNDADMLALNHNSLENSKVQLIVGDAYAHVFRSTETYDAIYLDFPYPDTFELSRLYSLEFYQAVQKRLSPDGFLVFDAPLWRYVDRKLTETPMEWRILNDTLQAAGFKTIFAFGPHEPFIFASTQERPVDFTYDLLPAALANASYVNLSSLKFMEVSAKKETKNHVNSIYKPQPFFKQ